MSDDDDIDIFDEKTRIVQPPAMQSIQEKPQIHFDDVTAVNHNLESADHTFYASSRLNIKKIILGIIVLAAFAQAVKIFINREPEAPQSLKVPVAIQQTIPPPPLPVSAPNLPHQTSIDFLNRFDSAVNKNHHLVQGRKLSSQ